MLQHTYIHTFNGTFPYQHATTQFFTGWMPFLAPNQQRQSTEGDNNNDNDRLTAFDPGQPG